MRVVRDLKELALSRRPTAATIGNFDGVHLAHQRLFGRVVKAARSAGGVAVAITFDPHPVQLLAPEHAPNLLTPLERKIQLIEKQGIDLLVVLPFTRELAHLSPREFVRDILVRQLHVVSVHVGPNFRFGYRQSGDTEVLTELAREEGFRLEVLPTLKVRGEVVSSTAIRESLSAGQVNRACRLLGRPYSTYGPIVAGLGTGHKHTVPTLNQLPVEEQLPKVGVYVTRTRLEEKAYESVTNVGYKPTFGQHELSVESYLLDFSGQVASAHMEVEFLFRLRDEIKFQNPAILKIQILEDARRAGKFFRLFRRFQAQRARRPIPAQDTSRM